MNRTEVVTITNMCMVYDGNTVLVQEKTDDDYKDSTVKYLWITKSRYSGFI